MAGSFGYEAEHHAVSMQMAELSLPPAVRAAGDAWIVADGASCRHQIADGAQREALHTWRVCWPPISRRRAAVDGNNPNPSTQGFTVSGMAGGAAPPQSAPSQPPFREDDPMKRLLTAALATLARHRGFAEYPDTRSPWSCCSPPAADRQGRARPGGCWASISSRR